MNTAERKRAIAEAKQRAEILATQIAQRGASDDATGVDRSNADTALVILEIAEKSAGLIFGEESAKRLQEFRDWGEKEVMRISEVADQGRMRESMDRVLAAIDLKREELLAWVDEQALQAWRKAGHELEAIVNERNT